jgi:hypothetical protein
MPEYTNVYDMTRETQVSELIGSTMLSTSSRIREDTDHIRGAVFNALSERTSLDIGQPGLGSIPEFLETEYRKQQNANLSDRKHVVELGILRGAWFIHLCLEELLKKDEEATTRSNCSGVPIVMCFSPSVVTLSILLGIPLILRSLHLTAASVLERLNSIAEDPRSFVLSEDTQRMFSNPGMIQRVTGSNSRSIPIASGFVFAATTTESGYHSLSGPFQSRSIPVATTSYSMEIIPHKPFPLEEMTLQLVSGNHELREAIKEIYGGLKNHGRVNVTITEYVRWCTTALNLFTGGISQFIMLQGLQHCERLLMDSLMVIVVELQKMFLTSIYPLI